MKTSLSHLPETKQREILEIVEIIKNTAAPEMVILFGSYATGKWVEDKYFEEGIHYEYISDYDFLIVTKEDKEKEYVLTEKILSRCRNQYHVPVSPIIHSIDYVNEGLEEGQYFFTEIIKNGILLYDGGWVHLKKAKELTVKEQQAIAQHYYNIWFFKSQSALKGAAFYFSNNYVNDAAFALHQSAERLYNTVLLVFAGYKPKTHNLDKLRKLTKNLSEKLFSIFPYPIEDTEEKYLFDVLKRAYIEARYKEEYVITEREFYALEKRLKKMQEIVNEISIERIQFIIKE